MNAKELLKTIVLEVNVTFSYCVTSQIYNWKSVKERNEDCFCKNISFFLHALFLQVHLQCFIV